MKKKKRLVRGGIVVGLVAIGIGLFVYREWTHSHPPVLEMKDIPQILSEDILEGETNCGQVKVSIDNELEKKLDVTEGSFSLEIDALNLETGWHHFLFSVQRPLTRWIIQKECFIQIVPEQANVYVPDTWVRAGRVGNQTYNSDYRQGMVENYTSTSRYFDQEGFREESDTVKFDDEGIVLIKYGEEWEYNPVSVAQQALGHYNAWVENGDVAERERFLDICGWFLSNQKENGAFPYEFSFIFKPTTELPEGFVSGMAQGQILSVLARAYQLTGDQAYLECGQRTLNFMIASGDDDIFAGCSRTLEDVCELSENMKKYSDYVVYEEYVFNPSTYVLNGDLFALIGLADWMMTAPEEFGKKEAKIAFENGIRGIEVLLPYYDYYGYSSYDLFQYTSGESTPFFNSKYAHKCHIYLLDALADISDSTTCEKYAEIFKNYSDDDFWKQTDVLYDKSRSKH